MINIAWLCAPIPAKGGPLIHILHWAKNIDKTKYNVTLIFFCSAEIRERVKALEVSGIEVIFMPELSELKKLYIPAIFKLTKLLKKKI